MLAPPAFSPNVSFFWPLCYFQKSKETTVGGSEILHRSVGSLSHYCDGLLYIPGGRAWDFWSIKSDRFQKKRVETRLPWRFSNLRRCCWLMCNDKYRATFLNNPFPLKTSTETSWKKNMPGCLGNLLGMKYTNPVMWCIRSHVWLGQWSLIPSFEETETRLPMHSFCFQNVISLCKKNTLLQIIYPYSKSIHFDVCCFCFTRFLRRKSTTEISAVLLFLRNVPRLRGLQAFCFDRLRPPRFPIHEN